MNFCGSYDKTSVCKDGEDAAIYFYSICNAVR